jgi:hypothetical protein
MFTGDYRGPTYATAGSPFLAGVTGTLASLPASPPSRSA